ncbi:MAG: hypothetical protein GY805_33860 [Chloroflexi bacterium]|nr:hypothetical protein [Chloroflexota bacterium]
MTSPTPRPFDDDDDGNTGDDGNQANFDDTESWEFMPFFGELRFDLLDA